MLRSLVGSEMCIRDRVRAEAEAQDTGSLPIHPNVNTRRRQAREDDIHLDDEVGDDLGTSFVGDDFPEAPPPWLSQVINAAVTAAATAALPQRQAALVRSSMAPTKLSDRKVPDFWVQAGGVVPHLRCTFGIFSAV